MLQLAHLCSGDIPPHKGRLRPVLGPTKCKSYILEEYCPSNPRPPKYALHCTVYAFWSILTFFTLNFFLMGWGAECLNSFVSSFESGSVSLLSCINWKISGMIILGNVDKVYIFRIDVGTSGDVKTCSDPYYKKHKSWICNFFWLRHIELAINCIKMNCSQLCSS